MSEPSHAQSDGARLARLEESAAFNERAIEQLSAEIADMNRRVAALTKRLAALEERLGKMEAGDEGSDEE